MHRATIYVDPIYSHVPTGFAQAVGVPGGIRFDFKTAGNLAYSNIADLFPQLVMRPFNRTTVYYYDIVIDDPVGASGLVTVPSEIMNDRFNVEVYAQDVDGNPQWLMARGAIDLTGYGHLHSGRRAAGATSGGGGGGGGSEPGGTAGQVQFNADPLLGGFGYWDGTSTLSLGNTTTPQVLKIYNTHAGTLAAPTSATWFEAKWVGGVLNLTTAGSGDASTAASMHISTGNESGYWDMEISAAYIALVAGFGGTATYYAAVDAFTPSANGTLNLGRSATRFKTVYAGNYVGANFSSVAQGLTPLSGGGTTNFLRADGTWASPGGGAIISDVAPSTASPSGSLWFEGDTGFFYVLYDSGTPAWVQIDNTGLPVPYTTGDLLYASNTTTLAKLSAGTAGHVLTSGGAGVAPAWAAGGGGGGTPGGSVSQVQWNNTTFAGITNLTTDGTNITALRLAATTPLLWDNAGTADVKLYRQGAGLLAQVNGANPQTFRIYNGVTAGTDVAPTSATWLEMSWGGDIVRISSSSSAGAGGALPLNISSGSVSPLSLTGGGYILFSGGGTTYYMASDALLASSNNVIDLGRTGSRWKTVFAANHAVKSMAGVPTATEIPDGTWMVVRDTSGATTKLYYNNGGTIQSVALA